MKKMSAIFYQAVARKFCCIYYVKGELDKVATMSPNPCATRWNSLSGTAEYHAEKFKLYLKCLEEEMKSSKDPLLL